jgi:methyl-accepting chemotaxis protein
METVAIVLSEASGSVARTHSGMCEIAASVREQSAASDGISRNVERMTGMIDENAVAAADVGRELQRLGQLSRSLHDAVREFRA